MGQPSWLVGGRMATYHWKPCKGHVPEADGSAAKLWRGSKQGQVVAGVVPHLMCFLQEAAHLRYFASLDTHVPSTDCWASRPHELHWVQ